METDAEADVGGPITVGSLRTIVTTVAVELRSKGRTASADRLQAAANLESSPAEEVLVMREAMVRTRSDWGTADVESRRVAARAIIAAKRLALEL